ncbi:DUF3419 family protein [Rubrimonas cliftonensis]|uniref:S-adenosylmethionine-diacylglycerol 3-amino-3-carboxypropyl transferase n=1 Tax=Rubrimonas cliftonensis TaxID=89524 RepID=A0A1H4B4D9_9RHOB|nr:DUF3419 family protein [Rubrimonas cliftonensis]SEA42888.1 S-adenosylmethionine-diacylglycerol 3-amino-3-carboxypropyl transferase [Rubrimonas cliftonensis]
MAAGTEGAKPGDADLLGGAVHRSAALSREGLLERAFTSAFSGLVYAQIWEDPAVDLAALELKPGSTIAAIASGGCNVMSYLTADPARVIAVDLNPHHVALVRLKAAAARTLPDHAAFLRMFGSGEHPQNPALYDAHVRAGLDAGTRGYWEGGSLRGRRIGMFVAGLYRQGLLGRFIMVANWAARRYGVDLSEIAACRTVDEQRRFFETRISPMLDRRLVRWITRRKASLFGLGIPPAQYDALAGDRPMAEVLRERLGRLACGFPMSENYFAWQAFCGGYGENGPFPPYLQAENWDAVRSRADRVSVENVSMTDRLAAAEPGSVDAVVLLDAQDWMTDGQLNAIWTAITRAAAPGARVIYRTAGEETILPGRVKHETLDRWEYLAERSAALHRADRSAIYGGFHIYKLKG